jgi:putative peptide zinc metalloprotease protein
MLTAGPSDDVAIPRLAEGVRLLGAYDSQGLTKPKFLAQRADGQVVLLSELLYLTARNLDGSPLELVATHVSEQGDRPLDAAAVAYLAETKLAPLGLVDLDARARASEPEAPKANTILGMAGKPFLPTSAVRVIAWSLRPLFWAPVMVVFLVGLVLADVWAFATQPIVAALQDMLLHPQYTLAALGLLVCTTIFHEFGHATACRYGGGKPGVIGAGVYLMFPAFYTDVTDSYRLPRRARLRVDLGGVYFNAIWIVGAAVTYHLAPYPPLLVVLAFSNITIIQQLLPVVRFDGYWVLSDLVGVPDLFARIGPAVKAMLHGKAPADLTRRARWIVTTWIAVIVPLLLVSSLALLVRMPGFLERSYHELLGYYHGADVDVHHQMWSATALAVLMMLFLLLPTVGLSILAVRSGKAAGGLVRARLPRPYAPLHMKPEPPEHEPFTADELQAYLVGLLKPRPHTPRLVRPKQYYEPLTRVKSAVEPSWPVARELEWWEERPLAPVRRRLRPPSD